MLQGWVILGVSFAYLCLLFAIAYFGDRRADQGRSVITPYVYALSLAVYCTSWTFYGSVGWAASAGVSFLPIYIGPTLVFILWWFILRKIIRISKLNRITSIADFISSRYGKSTLLSGLVTVIAVIGIVPYISLQLKAVSSSFTVLLQYPEVVAPAISEQVPVLADTAFFVALVMAAFTILFGTRHIDASEHHEGMVLAIAFESIVKLVAFLAVGIFVTFGIYGGFGDLFDRALADPGFADLLTVDSVGEYGQWVSLTLLSMAAIICLPRQFQVAVVENVRESHLARAVWLFPLYLLVINVFVLPIAFAGLLQFPAGQVDADTFVLTLPMAERQEALALFAFIGGLSAATGMAIVAAIALSTMVCNDLIMPVLLRLPWLGLHLRGDISKLLLRIRRGSIVFVMLLGYIYFRYIGESYALVTIGLVSFAAVAQFAPAIIGGIFWKGGTRLGALTGLSAGFLVWGYTLLLPSMAQSGWLAFDFIASGPYGIALLRPYELFGLEGLDRISHAVFWSMLANIGLYVAVSLGSRQSPIERVQAIAFVDVFRRSDGQDSARFWRGNVSVGELFDLVGRYVGPDRARLAFQDHARRRGLTLDRKRDADAPMIAFAERMLAGAIGGASARVVVASAVQGEVLDIEKVMEILDEASQVREYSHRLEQKSRQLEIATAGLKEANERLQELDRLKDDFLATVSHELRTPLTSIRSFSEILYDTPSIPLDQRQRFLDVIIKESERLTRLINQVLDLAKMEAGRMDWQIADLDPKEVIEQALAATNGLIQENAISLEARLPTLLPRIMADRDRVIQVIVNLISNAVKCCNPETGRVMVNAKANGAWLEVSISDNGPGIPPQLREVVFEKFLQAGTADSGKPPGTGLGLAICRQIIRHFGGAIWVESEPGAGATFRFTVPVTGSAGAQT